MLRVLLASGGAVGALILSLIMSEGSWLFAVPVLSALLVYLWVCADAEISRRLQSRKSDSAKRLASNRSCPRLPR